LLNRFLHLVIDLGLLFCCIINYEFELFDLAFYDLKFEYLGRSGPLVVVLGQQLVDQIPEVLRVVRQQGLVPR
jgi:hypothetical protein